MSSTPLHVANGSIEMLIVKSIHRDNCYSQLRFNSQDNCCLLPKLGTPLELPHSLCTLGYYVPYPCLAPLVALSYVRLDSCLCVLFTQTNCAPQFSPVPLQSRLLWPRRSSIARCWGYSACSEVSASLWVLVVGFYTIRSTRNRTARRMWSWIIGWSDGRALRCLRSLLGCFTRWFVTIVCRSRGLWRWLGGFFA